MNIYINAPEEKNPETKPFIYDNLILDKTATRKLSGGKDNPYSHLIVPTLLVEDFFLYKMPRRKHP